MTTETTESAPGSLVRVARRAYAAWGLSILNYVVPTAATAGILTVIVHTYDAGIGFDQPWDLRLVLGWFAAVLFVVSTGHSSEHDKDNPLGILLDLVETAAMVFAFHSLGLVTGQAVDALDRAFFGWIGLYLAAVLVRRAIRYTQMPDAERVAAKEADKWITILGAIVLAAMTFAWFLFEQAQRWCAHTGAYLSIVLWIALFAYLCLTFRRAK